MRCFFPWNMAVEAKCWCIFPMGQNVKANGPQIWWKSVVWTCHLSWAAQLVDHTHMNVFLWVIVMFAPWVHPLKLTWKPENWVKIMFLFVFWGFFVDLHPNPFWEAATSMGIQKKHSLHGASSSVDVAKLTRSRLSNDQDHGRFLISTGFC